MVQFGLVYLCEQKIHHKKQIKTNEKQFTNNRNGRYRHLDSIIGCFSTS
jgi:hypothetical protein